MRDLHLMSNSNDAASRQTDVRSWPKADVENRSIEGTRMTALGESGRSARVVWKIVSECLLSARKQPFAW